MPTAKSAIDMQKCGITDRGCSLVSQLLETNKDIVVFDLRKNNVVDMMAIPSIMNQLNDNKKLNDGAEYKWIFIPNTSSGEESSSGGASSSSYNLTYTNEKVAKYVETTVDLKEPDNSVRAVQSSSTLARKLEEPSLWNSQVKPYRAVQRSASSTIFNSADSSKRNVSSSGMGLPVRKKLVTSPVTLLRANRARYGHPERVAGRPNEPNPQRQLSTDNVHRSPHISMQLRSTQSDERIPSNHKKIQGEAQSEELGVTLGLTKRNERFSKTFVREEMLKQTLEVGKTHGKTGGTEQLVPLDSSDAIEQALQKLFKSLENSNEKPESKSSLNQITQDLTPSLSLEDFKADSNPFRKANRRIKETKQVCCLYFNRLEDGYED